MQAKQITWSQPPKTRDRVCHVGTVAGKLAHGEFKIWEDRSSVALYYTNWRDANGGAVPVQTRLVCICDDVPHAKAVAAAYNPFPSHSPAVQS